MSDRAHLPNALRFAARAATDPMAAAARRAKTPLLGIYCGLARSSRALPREVRRDQLFEVFLEWPRACAAMAVLGEFAVRSSDAWEWVTPGWRGINEPPPIPEPNRDCAPDPLAAVCWHAGRMVKLMAVDLITASWDAPTDVRNAYLTQAFVDWPFLCRWMHELERLAPAAAHEADEYIQSWKAWREAKADHDAADAVRAAA